MPSPRTPRRDGWTPARRARFLEVLGGDAHVEAAARAAGVSASSAYRLRARDAAFAEAWDIALETRRDEVVGAVLDRVVNGVEVAKYYRGRVVGHTTVYPARIALAILKRLKIGERVKNPPSARTS